MRSICLCRVLLGGILCSFFRYCVGLRTMAHLKPVPMKAAAVCPMKSSIGNLPFKMQHKRRYDTILVKNTMDWRETMEDIYADVDMMADPIRSFGSLALWSAFGFYALFGTPNEDAGASIDIFVQCLTLNYHANPPFQALFFLFGLWSLIYGAILVPMKPRSQKLPAWPFLSLLWALGMGSITPYLALMQYAPDAEKVKDPGIWTRRPTGALALIVSVILTMSGVGIFAPNDLNGGSNVPVHVLLHSYLTSYPALFASNKFVNLT